MLGSVVRIEMRALNAEQTAMLLATASGGAFEVPILTGVYAGLRLGELLGCGGATSTSTPAASASGRPSSPSAVAA